MASFNDLFGQIAGGLGAAGNPFSQQQIGQGLLNQGQAAAQNDQMNALLNQQMAAGMRQQCEQQLRRIQAMYPRFDPMLQMLRQLPDPIEAAKKCPPPRDPKTCPPPKAIPRKYLESIEGWMQPKPGMIHKIYTPIKSMTNRDRLRAEVAAWTRRAA